MDEKAKSSDTQAIISSSIASTDLEEIRRGSLCAGLDPICGAARTPAAVQIPGADRAAPAQILSDMRGSAAALRLPQWRRSAADPWRGSFLRQSRFDLRQRSHSRGGSDTGRGSCLRQRRSDLQRHSDSRGGADPLRGSACAGAYPMCDGTRSPVATHIRHGSCLYWCRSDLRLAGADWVRSHSLHVSSLPPLPTLQQRRLPPQIRPGAAADQICSADQRNRKVCRRGRERRR
uniref:Uncharacterized protein n=1 Tax=Ananas comosus var. bracteatus TaxID=296719 RepID=A0A6V7NQ98_ANACO|nr:unnamed protein product [Ananas comosus var. bracteatus]